MDVSSARMKEAGTRLRAVPWVGRVPVRSVLATFTCAYALIQAALAVSLAGSAGLLPVSLLLLVLLAAAVFVAGLLDGRSTAQPLYLALCVLPCLTIARLAFTAEAFSAFDPLFVYLLLAVALIGYRQTTGARPLVAEGFSGSFQRTFGLAVVLAAAFVAVALQFGGLGGTSTSGPPWLDLAVVAPVALLDELWFRGVLQGQLAASTSRLGAFLAVLVLFVAYGAPFGGLNVLAFRAGFGVAFGLVAVRRRNLPLVLVARVLMALALVLLVHAALGTSVIV